MCTGVCVVADPPRPSPISSVAVSDETCATAAIGIKGTASVGPRNFEDCGVRGGRADDRSICSVESVTVALVLVLVATATAEEADVSSSVGMIAVAKGMGMEGTSLRCAE